MSRAPERRPGRRRGRLALGLLVLTLAAVGSCVANRPTHDGPVTEHFDGQRFYDDPPVHKGFGQVLRWQLNREPGGPWVRDLTAFDAPTPPTRAAAGELVVTFVNHATVLIQADGLNLLTDPIWSERASLVSWAGPVRYRAPGIRFEDLPPIDVVLVSHNHFDHMDIPSLRRLAQEHDSLFILPLGNCFYLSGVRPARCVELDWWETRVLDAGHRVHAVPARHWSRRGALDTNRTLWAGFVIETPDRNIYFAGDTGMGEHFAQIRARYGPPDLALLPIGAYLPRWFMAPQHIDPTEAVIAHEQLGAAETMAIHFGTFNLADDGQTQPAEELVAAIEARGADRRRFWIPDHGESRRWRPGTLAHAAR